MKMITQSQYKSELTITPKSPILSGVNGELLRMEEVRGIMEQESSQSEQDDDNDLALLRRRAILASAFQALPTYGSTAFWSIVEEPQLKLTSPLEILVKCARVAIVQEDRASSKRIIEIIFRRIQQTNEYWSRHVLSHVHLASEERSMFAFDLQADLCERVIRALMDIKRLFWEENFQHCLCFERKHVYQAFMTREGRWYNQHANDAVTRRIPHSLIGSLDQPVQHTNGETWEMEIEDTQAQKALLAVEQNDLPLLIQNLPEKLKPVIWLIFWEGRTEKYVANLLGVSDRTIRNRLHKALELLRTIMETEGKTIDG